MQTKVEKIGGAHVIWACLQIQPQAVQSIHLQKNKNDRRLNEIQALAEQIGIPVKQCSRQQLDQLGGVHCRHAGVIAYVYEVPRYTEADLPILLEGIHHQSALLLILDGIQDPHNLGACLRSANAMGVDLVIAPKDRAAGITALVRQIASGAAEFTPFVPVTNLSRVLTYLKEQGIWLVGATESADTKLTDIELTGPIGLVMGSEGKGLRRLTQAHCDYLALIPTTGQISSLNVSVATGIFLYEITRQRSR